MSRWHGDLPGFLKFFLRATVSVGLLLWLLSRIDLKALFASFSSISAEAWISAFVLHLSAQVVSSIRWSVICSRLGFNHPFITYLKYYFVGMFFNLFLPSSIGGDVVKIFFMAKDGKGKLKATYSIFLDRAFGLWAMFTIGLLAVILRPSVLPVSWQSVVICAAIVLSLWCCLAPLAHNWLGPVFRVAVKKGGFFEKMVSVADYFFLFWKRPGNLFLVFCLSLVLQLCTMLSAYVLGIGLGIELSVFFYLSVLPLIAILTILPVSLSGIGIREGGFLFFFSMKGVSPEKALSLSLGFFAVQAAVALIGGAGYMAGVHKGKGGHE